jgi:hypothetical protein
MKPAVPTRSLRIKKYASRLMDGAKVSLEVTPQSFRLVVPAQVDLMTNVAVR